MMAYGISPQVTGEIRNDFRQLPSKDLISKIKGFCNPYSLGYFSPYPMAAMDILVERREKEAVPTLLRMLKRYNKNKRRTAIWALGVINDPRAIEPLMNIVKQGERHPNYINALMALSEMKYEGAFPYVVKRAKEHDAYRNGSVGLLKEFGKPECIPILIGIKNRIKNSDPLAKFGKSRIDDAIKEIEAGLKINKPTPHI